MHRRLDGFDTSMAAPNAHDSLSDGEKQTLIAHLEEASLMPMWMRLYNASRYAGLTQESISGLAAEWIALAEKYGVNKYGESASLTIGSLKQQYNL